MKNCIVIVGKIASGKSTIAREVAGILGYKFFEVSDVVRDLTGRQRDTIRLNQLTGQMIAEELMKRLLIESNYVVSGPRQYEILVELRKYFKVHLVKVDVCERERAKRAKQREESTLEQVREGDKLDVQLGFDKVLKTRGYTVKGNKCLRENVQEIVTYIVEKGVQ